MHTSDSYIEIGSSHNICQDYAINGDYADLSYIAVSDGCSSSPDTDIGSRIMCLSFRTALDNFIRSPLFPQFDIVNRPNEFGDILAYSMQENIRRTIDQFRLPLNTMDATLVACIIYNGKIFPFIWGDGYIKFDFNYDDFSLAFGVKYETNAPYYLSYMLDANRNKAYMDQYGQGLVYHYQYNFKHNTKSLLFCDPIATRNSNGMFASCYELKDIKSISVFSDGVESFNYSANKLSLGQVDSTQSEVVKSEFTWMNKFTSFKNVHGDFVKRRLKRERLDAIKNGIEHFDDISIATMQVNHGKN